MIKRKPKTASRMKRPYKTPAGTIVKLTDGQKQFADALISAKTSKELIGATQAIYQTDAETARVITSENIRKPSIIEYLGDRGYRALDVLNEAMNAREATWSERIKAADSLADRQFGRATQRLETASTSLNITIDLTKSTTTAD